MKVIIAGSRSITDKSIVDEAISESKFLITEVVSGKAPGVDALGEEWAKARCISVRPFRALWRIDGVLDRGAGMKRNTAMAEYADALIAIWDGRSPGTKDMINKATKFGLKIYITTIKPSEEA